MSDYEVTLVNDNSKLGCFPQLMESWLTRLLISVRSPAATICRRVADIMGNRQEFYVRFKGPEESQFCSPILRGGTELIVCSTIPRRSLESPRRAPGSISVQIT
jgi:hypothetical protein